MLRTTLWFAILAMSFTGCQDLGGRYECTFDRIGGTYLTNGRELAKQDRLIRVTKNGHHYMFERNQIALCELM